MKILPTAPNSTQQSLLRVKNFISNPLLRLAKLKNRVNSTKPVTTKPIQKALFSSENDKENVTPEKLQSGLVQASKKIQKTNQKPVQIASSRKVLADITNAPQTKSSGEKSTKKPQIEKSFLEDGGTKQTANYVTLTYINMHTRHTYRFYCFHDKDLSIPADYATKTITHSCDNDCTTDEDQIRGAIKNLYRSIESQLKEQKEIENYLKRP